MQASSADPVFREWEPRELGLAWASLLAVILAGAIMAFCYFVSTALGPKPQMQVIQVTQVTLAELPGPPPLTVLPPPLPPPPPKPVPVVISPPPPVASKIVVPAKPLPVVVHPVSKPVQHPRARFVPPPRPAPVRPVLKPMAPPAPAPPPVNPAPKPMAPVSGIPVYGGRVYSIIQANQNVPPVLVQLGLSGTAVIGITVAPDGRVVAARVVKSSGVPLVDQTALEHARNAALPPFNDEMPQQPSTFLIPIEISPQPSSD